MFILMVQADACDKMGGVRVGNNLRKLPHRNLDPFQTSHNKLALCGLPPRYKLTKR